MSRPCSRDGWASGCYWSPTAPEWWNLYRGRRASTSAAARGRGGVRAAAVGARPDSVRGDRRGPPGLHDEPGRPEQIAVLTVSTGELSPRTDPDVTVNSLAVGSGTVAAVLGHVDRPTRPEPARSGYRELDRGPGLVDSSPGSGRGLGRPAGDLAGYRRGGARLVLPADEPGLHSSARLATAADHAEPRRPDDGCDGRSSGSATSSGPPGASPSWTSTTAAVPGSGARIGSGWTAPGASSTSRTVRPAPWRWAQRGLADPERLAIKGGSAGGYTTLRALTVTDVFAAGISAVRHRRPGVARGRDPQVRVSLHRLARRPVPARSGRLPRPLPHRPSRPAVGSDPAAAGPRRQGGAAQPGRD